MLPRQQPKEEAGTQARPQSAFETLTPRPSLPPTAARKGIRPMPATKKKPAAKKRATRGCACANLVDNKLRDFNTRLKRQFCLNTSESTIDAAVVIETEKVDGKKRMQKKTVLPTYCPFCGKKY